MYDSCMLFNLIISTLLATAQPVCTESNFVEHMGKLLTGEHEVIARAIFEDYTSKVITVHSPNTNQPKTPYEILEYKENQAKKMDSIFDELTESLSVINRAPAWQRCIHDLRRSVLLNGRQTNNPWEQTIWINPSDFVALSNASAKNINSFLQNAIDEDRTYRFAALKAKRINNYDACRSAEKKAMTLWHEFYKQCIQPYQNDVIEYEMYKKIDHGEDIKRMYKWVLDNVIENEISSMFKERYANWLLIHTRQLSSIKKLILKTRVEDGYDPLSNGCGHTNERRFELLKQEAEMSTINAKFEKDLRLLLTDEQNQSFENSE